MAKKGPWHPNETKPCRVGVYETRFQGINPLFQYWNGWRWSFAANTVNAAYKRRDMPSPMRPNPSHWRGVLKGDNDA